MQQIYNSEKLNEYYSIPFHKKYDICDFKKLQRFRNGRT